MTAPHAPWCVNTHEFASDDGHYDEGQWFVGTNTDEHSSDRNPGPARLATLDVNLSQYDGEPPEIHVGCGWTGHDGFTGGGEFVYLPLDAARALRDRLTALIDLVSG